jgi:hypothetical protein
MIRFSLEIAQQPDVVREARIQTSPEFLKGDQDTPTSNAVMGRLSIKTTAVADFYSSSSFVPCFASLEVKTGGR